MKITKEQLKKLLDKIAHSRLLKTENGPTIRWIVDEEKLEESYEINE